MSMTTRRMVFIAVAAALAGVLLLLLAAGVLFRARGQDGAGFPPPPSVAVPPSIDDLAARFPALAPLLRDPRMSSALKEFAIAHQTGGLEAARDLAQLRGFMNRNGDLTLTVLADTDDTTALAGELQGLGVKIISRRERELKIVVPAAVLQAAIDGGQDPAVLLARLTQIAHVRAILPAQGYLPQRRQLDAPASGVGASEGVRVSRAGEWHAAGITGTGVKVGVLDPEVSRAFAYIGTALPGDTQVYTQGCVDDAGIGVDGDGAHGVAAGEIIHEMAPGAQLFLACEGGDTDEAIDWLVDQGVRIISHSAGGFYGPRDGSGAFQQRIDALSDRGILWVNSAGNAGQSFHQGRLSGSDADYEHEFSAGRTTMGVLAEDGVMRVMLNWSEWRAPAPSDYDLYLYDDSGALLASSTDDNTAMGYPMESLTARVTPGRNYYVKVSGAGQTAPVDFLIAVNGAERVEFPTPEGSVAAPGDARASVTVGAVEWDTDRIAEYSSRGPTEDGRLKPDISAPTGVSSQVYEDVAGFRFGGTSAAAPHVAGAAALVWSQRPDLTRQEVVEFLIRQATDRGPAGPDVAYGAGRLDLGAPEALAPMAPPSTAAPTPPAIASVTPVADVLTPTALPASTLEATTPAPGASADASPNAPAGLVIAAGLGCAGGALLILGGTLLVAMWRRNRKAAAATGAPPRGMAYSLPQPPPQTRARFCRQCGHPVSQGARFCGACGKPLSP